MPSARRAVITSLSISQIRHNFVLFLFAGDAPTLRVAQLHEKRAGSCGRGAGGVLEVVEAGVETVLSQEFGVVAGFADAALVQHIDAVHIADGGDGGGR